MPECTLSVVIVSWNVRDLLANCLESLERETVSIPCEVFVVDNKSSDGTLDMVRARFPRVRIIANAENVGFSRANNQAIRLSSTPYVLLLNPDTICTSGSVRRMLDFLEQHAEVGAVGPMLLDRDGSTVQLEGARRFPRPFDTLCEYLRLGALFPRSRWPKRHLMVEWDHQDSRRVECLSGACLMIRRETLADIGDLDESYPFNVEDVDWCRRVVESRRWILYYLGDARIVHFGRQSIVKNRGVAALGAMRGIYRYYGKFDGWPTALGVWALLWPVSFAKLGAWMATYLVFPGKRPLAREQIATFWRICCLSPWPAGVAAANRAASAREDPAPVRE